MNKFSNIVILTGAGISAESGIDTFRSEGGLWEQHRIEDVATPEAFQRNPDLVYKFYDVRREAIQKAQPNAAHISLGKLCREWHGDLTIITQNVDDLHERGGAVSQGNAYLIHMHGEHLSAWCMACGERHFWRENLAHRPPCPTCHKPNMLRPDIVWFGEMPYQLGEIDAALRRADLFVSIGTSGAVYPAGGYVRRAKADGIATLELNLEPSKGSHYFDEARYGPATQIVPKWVEEILSY
ncbi:NAD-dependent protein deacylase [Sphingorhabdus lutea]|uniref:NAD-dependent protein deacylase n=1 Tax=Sphingorhabdus lutea TaxID=1913578 RepID=A0A1L3JB54_9SPHN|nr:NAD-dependent deacylase [Sphingorhabdus lutea]APG62374.1 NAD-dependent protein deacylase [Sphingorhabdus lutea]